MISGKILKKISVTGFFPVGKIPVKKKFAGKKPGNPIVRIRKYFHLDPVAIFFCRISYDRSTPII
jgi:hypothetical protein